jgi:hypothetical protein
VDGDNSLENLDRRVEEVSSYHQEHNSKNLSSLGDQVKRVEDLNSLENLDRRVEEDKDKGFSSRSFLSGKFCCQSVN